MGAFFRLGHEDSLRTLEDVREVLCTGEGNGCEDEFDYNSYGYDDCYDENTSGDGLKVTAAPANKAQNNNPVWEKKRYRGNFPFAAKYKLAMTQEHIEQKRKDAKRFMEGISPSNPMRIRMNWGNTQEATAILTALNYFSKLDPELKLREVGMCGAGLDLNITATSGHVDASGLLVGASPDAVIEFSNGTQEVLEVKNHCPYVPTKWMRLPRSLKQEKLKMGQYCIRELPIQASVPPAYIPQLMMEMMCVGENCRSAIMVRQTATGGAIILRMHRDDDWIDEAMHWLHKFMVDYVNTELPPPPNFFWNFEDNDESRQSSKRYRKFVQWTKDLSEQVDVVERVPHSLIQRVLGEQGVQLPLFLDDIKSLS